MVQNHDPSKIVSAHHKSPQIPVAFHDHKTIGSSKDLSKCYTTVTNKSLSQRMKHVSHEKE